MVALTDPQQKLGRTSLVDQSEWSPTYTISKLTRSYHTYVGSAAAAAVDFTENLESFFFGLDYLLQEKLFIETTQYT